MTSPIDQIVRVTVRQTAAEARYVVTLSRELREHLERGEAKLAGQTAGEMLKWAFRMLDDGASMRDVRALIELGDRAAQPSERVA